MEADLVMREVELFIAASLDGYIADKDGSVNWLCGQDKNSENKDVYSEFIKDVDDIIMGWTTYHQIVTELSPDEWGYHGMKTYVITHKEEKSTDEIIFTDENPCDLVNELKKKPGKKIWICGGASVINQLMQSDLIDTYYIEVFPTILGGGVRLFDTLDKKIDLRLTGTLNYNGITDLIYTRR